MEKTWVIEPLYHGLPSPLPSPTYQTISNRISFLYYIITSGTNVLTTHAFCLGNIYLGLPSIHPLHFTNIPNCISFLYIYNYGTNVLRVTQVTDEQLFIADMET